MRKFLANFRSHHFSSQNSLISLLTLRDIAILTVLMDVQCQQKHCIVFIACLASIYYLLAKYNQIIIIMQCYFMQS